MRDPENGCLIHQTIDTEEALYLLLNLDYENSFIPDIKKLFEEECEDYFYYEWIEGNLNDRYGIIDNYVYKHSWDQFSYTVKYKNRFHFYNQELDEHVFNHEQIPVKKVLDMLGSIINESNIIKSVPKGAIFYRARVLEDEDSNIDDPYFFNAPPSKKATAGRMNPEGISYLYTALESKTAIAEVLSFLPCKVLVAKFIAIKSLNIIDFSNLPDVPSVFDESKKEIRENILFLKNFSDEISKPIKKFSSILIEYIPTQILSEYIALVFRTIGNNQRIDGIIYKSSASPGGKNLVLFPIERRYEQSSFPVKIEENEKPYVQYKFDSLDCVSGFETNV